MSPLDWMKRDTQPTPEELARFEGLSAALREVAANDLEPLDEEVHALAAWRPKPAQTGGLPLGGLLVPVVLSVAVAVLVTALTWRPTEIERPWQSSGVAAYEATLDGPVTTVVQGLGTKTWQVDPVAPSGTFNVIAGDVRVTVLGTLFTVVHAPPEVTVTVEEGRVQIDHPWGRDVLGPGQSWSRIDAMPAPDSIVAVRHTEPAPGTRAAPETPRAEEPEAPAIDARMHFAEAMQRFDGGDRSAELASTFAALIPYLEAPLGTEAEALSLQVGATAWPAEEARTALTAWLDTHHGAPRRWSVLEARADLERTRLRRCDLALPSYTALATRPDRAGKARAYAWLGLCAGAEGRQDLSVTALRQALDHGVSGTLREEVELALAGLK